MEKYAYRYCIHQARMNSTTKRRQMRDGDLFSESKASFCLSYRCLTTLILTRQLILTRPWSTGITMRRIKRKCANSLFSQWRAYDKCDCLEIAISFSNNLLFKHTFSGPFISYTFSFIREYL